MCNMKFNAPIKNIVIWLLSFGKIWDVCPYYMGMVKFCMEYLETLSIDWILEIQGAIPILKL